MADKIYHPIVEKELELPVIGSIKLDLSTVSKKNEPKQVKPKVLPHTVFSHEVLSSSLNTQARQILGKFTFAKMGAIKIGEYKNGVSGEINISPEGIMAKNKNGDITFTLNGQTGDATFAGSLLSGSVITGQVIVGSNNIILDGVNKRIIMNDGVNDRLLLGYQSGGF